MYNISKKFSFSASHVLMGLVGTHPCSRLHGHNYTVKVTLESDKLNSHGFVVDYRDLDQIKQFIDAKLDHRHLNDCLDVNPTAENIAKFIFKQFAKEFPKMISVTVSETDKTCAVYTPFCDTEE